MPLTRVNTGLVTGRSDSITSNATIAPNSGIADAYEVTALAVAATIAAPIGTPQSNQRLLLKIKDNGTARALTWTTTSGGYRGIDVTLPTTTIVGKVLLILFNYNQQDNFWDLLSVNGTGSAAITLTTTGTSGAATLTGNVLNIPQYSGGTTTNSLTIGTGLTGTSFNGSSAVTITIDSTVATLTGTQTLSNKTLTSPVISTITNTGTLTLPTTTGTLALVSQIPTVNNATLTLAVSGVGLTGSQTFTANQSTAATFTVTSNATNANTASTIVARDASGNFTAGAITASSIVTPAISNVTNSDVALSASGTGRIKLNNMSWPATDGTADYVLKTNGSGVLSWAAGSGGETSTVTIDSFSGTGSQTNFTLSVAPTSVNYITVTINGVSQQRTTYSVSGTTLSFSEAPPINAIIEIETISVTVGGVASQLTTGRTISLTGDVSYTSPSFNGTQNITGTATLNNTAVIEGTYILPTITVDSKGRITDASGGIGKIMAFNAGLAML